MLFEPQKRISERALPVWRITGGIYSLIALIICGGAIALTIILEWPVWIIAAAIILLILDIYFFVYLFPLLKWKRWRYEVRDQEIELQHGIFIVKRTLVPMIRVQHVDTKQGPILRKYDLATVAVSTAATVHEIPALELGEAEELRVFISRLARVADEDV
ncbi:PH domain-containing protein [Robertmurraya andreesenii]|uniref:Membrane protein YdbS with pleckstrin-like domain n=1 Tax=Anoxybacillus andreesenii TaxID=1325932 RepID=A0ABT9V3Z3_9BACL|nr:PH domain-containing protein [Robertmurraya andreesenii]MDQ0155659.1 membrane protein YdbS with pleckstrin-like domain [Robertmurraya andreesenii]